MDVIVMTAQIILSLSILVGLHELGHLVAAKFFGMRVEQFSIGFPPKIFKFKYGETEYALSAIPLGGYVKISGMIDESLDTEKMKEEPQPWEFRSKPAWQRLIVMLGGIVVNIVTGIVIFILMTYLLGEVTVPRDVINENGGIVAYELAEKIGLKTGDQIVKINGKEFHDFSDVKSASTYLEEDAYYTVIRGNETLEIQIPSDFLEDLSDKDKRFIDLRIPPRVAQVEKSLFAGRYDIREGDLITGINGTPVKYFDEVRTALDGLTTDTLSVEILRGSDKLVKSGYWGGDSIIGFRVDGEKYIKSIGITKDYSLAQAIPIGVSKAFSIVFVQIKAFGKMFSGDLNVRKSLSGPIGIAEAYGSTWDWVNFWFITGMLSMVLAFMNLLPIPALDGGHVMFLSYEMVSGRKPSDKFMEVAQKAGMIILLALMVFVFSNDILKLFGI